MSLWDESALFGAASRYQQRQARKSLFWLRVIIGLMVSVLLLAIMGMFYVCLTA
jgi:hypothetical protein